MGIPTETIQTFPNQKPWIDSTAQLSKRSLPLTTQDSLQCLPSPEGGPNLLKKISDCPYTQRTPTKPASLTILQEP